jgi:hypothetical protein
MCVRKALLDVGANKKLMMPKGEVLNRMEGLFREMDVDLEGELLDDRLVDEIRRLQ